MVLRSVLLLMVALAAFHHATADTGARSLLQFDGGFDFTRADAQATAISSGDGMAFAQATAQSFGQDTNSEAFASALSQGIQQRGCSFYQQAFAQAQAIAQSNGWGQSFARATASSSAITQCFGQSLGFSQATATANALSESNGFGNSFGRKMLQFGNGLSQGSNSGFSQGSDSSFNNGLGRSGFNTRYTSAEAQATAISSGGANSEAFAQATAVAFHNGGSDARTYANAISEGIRQHGCRFYQTVIAQAQAIAVSNGWGQSFAEATATVTVINSCGWRFGGLSG